MTTETQIILTAALFGAMLAMMYLTKLSLRKFTLLRSIDANRRKVILNLIYFSIYILTFIVLGIIWGVNMNQLTLFVSSVLAVLGVGTNRAIWGEPNPLIILAQVFGDFMQVEHLV